MEAARRVEATRLLGIAEKLLQNKDFTGSRDFAILSQETDSLLDGPDQILAVADVLLAADNRISNRNLDWYGILQVDRRSEDLELIRKQYRRLALLLHPDKNQFAWADSAFRLVAEAWGVLSNAAKKSAFDAELGFFTRVDLVPVDNPRAFGFQQFNRQEDIPPPQQQQPQPPERRTAPAPQPVRRTAPPPAAPAGGSSRGGDNVETRVTNFWTTCPYCYNLYEYPKVYMDCCLRCQNCERAFHAVEIEKLPPAVPGKDAYYCYWGFFPVGFSAGVVKDVPPPPVSNPGKVKEVPTPPVSNPPLNVPVASRDGFVPAPAVNAITNAPKSTPNTGARKRGRPRKNALP